MRVLVVAATLTAVACGGTGDGGAHDAARDSGAAEAATDGASDGAVRDSRLADSASMDGLWNDGGSDSGGRDGARDADAPVCNADVDLGTATGVYVVDAGSNSDQDDTLTPGCSPFSTGAEVVYRWSAPSADTWVFDTLGGGSLDTVLYVRDAACRELACNDNVTGMTTASRVELDVSEGEELFVVVDGRRSTAGEYLLSITPAVDAETLCDDMIDNDRDGRADCRDRADCRVADPEHCIEVDCSDGLDNNDNDFTDCADLDCEYLEPCLERTCGDGVDNDGNGQTDCEDVSCSLLEPCIETSCGDASDNDEDGQADCDDGDCACSDACTPDPCPAEDLGSALGTDLARGRTVGLCGYRVPSTAGGCLWLGIQAEVLGSPGEATFRWTAPADGTYTFDTVGSDFNTVLYLLDGSCGGPELACNDDALGSVQSSVTVSLSADQTVVVVLDGVLAQVGDYVLSISAT